MEKLFTEGRIGNVTLKNRWIMLAMHTQYANNDGTFSDRDYAFYLDRAKGGAAAITLVGAINKLASQDTMHRLDRHEDEAGLKKICNMIHGENCKVFMQLFHAGRNNTVLDGNESPIAPSPIPSSIWRTMPREMNENDIQETISDFASAARRCKECGVDVIEVSASAGYLLAQFLSPLTNKRNDRWGGDAQRRMKFPTECLKSIRNAVGREYPVIIKISGGDMLGGYDLQYMVDFINQLPERTINGVTVTGGWHEAPVPQISYHVEPGGFAFLAEEIKKKTRMTVIACNRFNSCEVAKKVIDEGIIDFIGAGRAFITDPSFVVKSKNGQLYNKCQACNRGCIERVIKHDDVQCAFNPEAGREYLGKPIKRYNKVLVVGAGPVGLETAKLLLEMKTEVTVITDSNYIGGKLLIAAAPPLKSDLNEFGKWLESEVIRLGGTILKKTPISKELIESIKPEHIYFAAGAAPIEIKIEGLQESELMTIQSDDVLRGKLPADGSKIVIIGGGTVGLETAEYLASTGKSYQITVLEMAKKAGKDLGGIKWIVMHQLEKMKVKVETSVRVIGSKKGGLIALKEQVNEFGKIKELEIFYHCDCVIFAVGSKARELVGMKDYIDSIGIGYHILGDGLKSRNIMEGLKDAWNAVRD